ncbi:MAG: helix-turn-helix transcriptional regulator [Cyanobacteria bacterium J06626_6]
MLSHPDTLQALMQAASIQSYRALAEKAEVSRWQIQQLRAGNIEKMRVENLKKIGHALNISLTDLLAQFAPAPSVAGASPIPQPSPFPQTEPKRLSSEMPTQQQMGLPHALQVEALQTLETWLIQWPTIAKRVAERPDLPAAKLLPFIRPVEQLMADWHVEAIAPIDAQLPYDPQYHQLSRGTAQPGDLVQVTHSGCTHQGKLLHRARVKPTDAR